MHGSVGREVQPPNTAPPFTASPPSKRVFYWLYVTRFTVVFSRQFRERRYWGVYYSKRSSGEVIEGRKGRSREGRRGRSREGRRGPLVIEGRRGRRGRSREGSSGSPCSAQAE